MPDPTGNPVHIHRADLLAALDLIAITDTASIARIVITPEDVEITRYVKSKTGGVLLDVLRDRAATTTTRIEIR